MKGNEKIIIQLNKLLAEELTAVNQYMVHAEMCANWGYKRLHDAVQKRAIDEMKHAEKLIARILFLDGHPMVSNLNIITIGKNIEEQIKYDTASENDAIKSYNDSIQLARELGDNGTVDLLETLLMDEEKHIDLLDTQLDQIKQMELKNFLVEQTI